MSEHICPITGKSCIQPKIIHITKIENGFIQQLDMCHECGQSELTGSPIKDEIWQTFVNKVFRNMKIDQMFSEEKLENIKKNIKNKDDLNNFMAIIMKDPPDAPKPVIPAEVMPKPFASEKNDDKCECGTTLDGLAATGKLGCAKCYDTFRTFLSPLIARVQSGATNHVGKRPKTKIEPEVNIIDIEKQMALAIKEERYEDAAKFRDKIKAVKSK